VQSNHIHMFVGIVFSTQILRDGLGSFWAHRTPNCSPCVV